MAKTSGGGSMAETTMIRKPRGGSAGRRERVCLKHFPNFELRYIYIDAKGGAEWNVSMALSGSKRSVARR